jgi:hypothetical protein
MPKHSKHRLGCDCLNQVEGIGDGIQGGRCTYCVDPYHQALCAYVAHFECSYYTGDATREKITEPCVVLRKDCIFNCAYSSRWACSGSNPTNDAPVLQWPECQGLDAPFGARCPGCETIGCITGTITLLNIDPNDSLCNTEEAGTAGTVELDFTLRYYGNEVTTPHQEPPYNEPLYPGSCMWSGIPVVRSSGRQLYANPIFMDYIDGAWRLRFYYRNNFPPGTVGNSCTGPADIGDFAGNFVRNDFDLPYFTCDPESFTDIDVSGTFFGVPGNVELSIRDWSIDPRCPTPAFISLSACTWAEDPCAGSDGCDQSLEPVGLSDEFGDSTDDCFTKWRLILTSETTATLDLTTREGFFAHYVCNDFHCYERSTFTMPPGCYDAVTNPGGQYSREVIGLPLCLCVSPLSYANSVCANSGQEACCDSGGPTLNVKINVVDCDGETIIENTWWPFTRGADLPCGVPNPFPNDPCLYFAAQIPVDDGCDDWGGDLFVVMYCGSLTPDLGVTNPCMGNGPDHYGFIVYCFNNDTGCWEERDSFCSSYTCQCLGPNPPEATFTKDCCCEPCESCLNDVDALVLSDGTNMLTLTFVEGVGWFATGASIAGCDAGEGWIFGLNCETGTAGIATDSGSVVGSTPSFECNPFSASFSVTGCDGNPYTLTVTE